MYSTSQLLRGLTNPKLAKNKAIEHCWKLYSTGSRTAFRRIDPPITEMDWDNLLLLDACRHDLFEDVNMIPGDLHPRYSIASNTAEYVRKTFRGRRFGDMVCVTATPKYIKPNVEDSFHQVIHVWQDDWDDEHRTVLPGVMNQRVIEAHDQYPNKRILAHYNQPHVPFIGETGQKLPHKIVKSGGIIEQGDGEPILWEAVKDRTYDRDTVWKAYRENLDLTLRSIREDNLIQQLDGKTVITSDHGNAFGTLRELGVVGHPPYRHINSLIKVPWLELPSNRRKNLKQGNIGSRTDTEDSVVNQRLADLGYVQ